MANGAIRFIALDSTVDWELQDQWSKREEESDDFKLARFRIVVVHVPPFLEYWDPEAWFQQRQSEWGAFVKDRYVPISEEAGIKLVISGHQHNYERGERKGIHYAIFGGGGGDLDFDQFTDWGMCEDFHFALLEFNTHKDNLNDGPWTLRWDTFDSKGKKVDSMLIHAQSREEKK